MNIVRNAFALVLGFLPVVIGCVQPSSGESDEAVGDEEVGEAQQADGIDKNNGLDKEHWLACRDDLVAAMNVKLYLFPGVFNTALPASVQPNGYCAEARAKAETCAKSLYSAKGWIGGGGISNDAKQEVMACVAALVNETDGVSVCIDGADIDGGGLNDCYDHLVPEAVWKTNIDQYGNVKVYVWALKPKTACSNPQMFDVLKDRFCTNSNETSLANCGITLRDSIATDCTIQNTHYTCLGGPALDTSLTSGAWLTLWAPTCD